MPEIPDLEVIRGFLTPVLRDNPVRGAEARQPWLVRTGAAELETLPGTASATCCAMASSCSSPRTTGACWS